MVIALLYIIIVKTNKTVVIQAPSVKVRCIGIKVIYIHDSDQLGIGLYYMKVKPYVPFKHVQY